MDGFHPTVFNFTGSPTYFSKPLPCFSRKYVICQTFRRTFNFRITAGKKWSLFKESYGFATTDNSAKSPHRHTWLMLKGGSSLRYSSSFFLGESSLALRDRTASGRVILSLVERLMLSEVHFIFGEQSGSRFLASLTLYQTSIAIKVAALN